MAESICLHYTVPGDDFTRAGEASADLKQRLKKLGIPPGAGFAVWRHIVRGPAGIPL